MDGLRAANRAGRRTRCRRRACRRAGIGVEVGSLCFFREEPFAAASDARLLIPIVDDLPFEVFPVIETGAAEVIVVNPEAERSNQPELGPDGDAGAADTAGVVGDLRLVEDDVQPRFVMGVIRA